MVVAGKFLCCIIDVNATDQPSSEFVFFQGTVFIEKPAVTFSDLVMASVLLLILLCFRNESALI